MEANDDTDAALVADLSEARAALSSQTNTEPAEDFEGPTKKRKLKSKTAGETSEARRESHKIIEQKRRQKINDKINELRELLNYPDGSQNKAVVLQAAVDNIKNLKVVCSKLLSSHRQLQEEYLHILADNERLRKSEGIPPYSGMDQHLKKTKDVLLPSSMFSPSMDLRLPDMTQSNPMGYLYDEGPSMISTIPQRSQQHRNPLNLASFTKDDFNPQILMNPNPFANDPIMGSTDTDSNRQALNRLLFNSQERIL